MIDHFLPPLYHILFASVLHLLLLLLCRHLPYSFFFVHSHFDTIDGHIEEVEAFEQLPNISRSDRELARNASREDEQHQDQHRHLSQHGLSRLALLVLTVRRQGVSYLGKGLLALHKEVLDQPPVVFVCTGQDGLEFKDLPFPLLQPNTARLIGIYKAERDFVISTHQLEITVHGSDVEHILILEDDVFPLLPAWITFHQKRLESEPWLDVKLSHDMGWAWDTRPLVELLTVTRLLALLQPDKRPKD